MAREVLGRIEAAAGRVARVVVLHLVVVPGGDHRELRVQVAQRLVGAVERVLLAVVGERDRLAHDRRVVAVGPADLVVAHARLALGVVALAVDVVAEADDEVEVLALEQLVGVVVAVRVVGAGEEAEAHGLVRVGRQRGLEAADRRVRGLGLEAVVVALVRVQALDPGLHRVALGVAGGDRARGDDAAERGVAWRPRAARCPCPRRRRASSAASRRLGSDRRTARPGGTVLSRSTAARAVAAGSSITAAPAAERPSIWRRVSMGASLQPLVP